MYRHVTVVPTDQLVLVDGHALRFAFDAPERLHALQWHEGSGHLEFTDGAPNQPLVRQRSMRLKSRPLPLPGRLKNNGRSRLRPQTRSRAWRNTTAPQRVLRDCARNATSVWRPRIICLCRTIL